jgi:AraC-like DNA-binding protein
LLSHVIRAYGQESLPTDADGTSITAVVKELLEELHESVGIGLGIEELADRHHLSRTHLEREFKRCMGIPLGQYIRTLCMERAKYWLRQPRMSVTEVAERLGFSSIHPFSVFFKRHSGLSPMAFRKGRLGESSGGNDEKR